MRKIVVVLIALLMIVGTQAVTRAQQQGEQWAISATYTAPDGSVSIQYPSQWQVANVTSVPGMVATFQTPSGAVNFLYGELSIGTYQGLYTSLDGFKNSLWAEPESSGHSFTATQIAGHPAYRVDQPLESGTDFSIDFAIDYSGTLAILHFQGGAEAPHDLDASDLALILNMAESIEVPAGKASPPADATAAATDSNGAPSTSTFTTDDNLYALTAPANWSWMSDPSGNGTATMFDMADGLSGTISIRVNSGNTSMVDFMTTYFQKPMTTASMLSVAKLGLPGLDAAQGTYSHPGSGQIYLIPVRNKVLVISMNADDAVLRSQNAAILSMLASIVPGGQAAKSAAAYAAEYAIAPAAPKPTMAPTNAPVVCSVSASSTANLRSGPGTSFAKAGTLAAGTSASVTGRAAGSDGKVWYQLDGGSYVRSDLVVADGDCASVPTVSP